MAACEAEIGGLVDVNRRFGLFALTLVISCPGNIAAAAERPPRTFSWQREKPETLGISSARLEALRHFVRTEPTTAMMIVVRGKVIFEYGDVTKVSKIASIRKSLLTMLLGDPVIQGKVDLTRTVVDLGLQEKVPFVPNETHATLEDLVTARSGIYLDQETDDLTRQQPRRGSQYPGTYFYYNNWEFDAAGTAFERLTGRNIYDALESELAVPLAMEDFHRELQQKNPTPGSTHPEYAMYLSTRDMARIGLLMLHMGSWNGRQVIPADWVRYMTSIVTPWDEMNPPFLHLRGAPERWGFGAGWWVWDAAPFPGGLNASPYQGAYEARGSGGQYITVLPSKDMVIVQKVDLDQHPNPAGWMHQEDWDAITNLVIGSFCRSKCG